MTSFLQQLSQAELKEVSDKTLSHYEQSAERFWQGTKDHDVSQNVDALLRHASGEAPLRILDFGCGPGRDLRMFKKLGHEPVGLDGSARFVEMARRVSTCEVYHQDFLELDLPSVQFDAVFANASLFHVPTQELPRVLRELWCTLREGGILFCSNPRGPNREEWNGMRYGAFLNLATWRAYLSETPFVELEHYYRPAGKPRAEQPWLAMVWRKEAF